MEALEMSAHVVDYYAQHIDYDPVTGIARWKYGQRRGHAIMARNDNGYITVQIAGKTRQLHRVNVRVRMDGGTLNARMLCDIRAAMADQARKGGES